MFNFQKYKYHRHHHHHLSRLNNATKPFEKKEYSQKRKKMAKND
jgi:hypothetical protein